MTSFSQILNAWKKGNYSGRKFSEIKVQIWQDGILERPIVCEKRGVTTPTNAVSGQSQNCSRNLEISSAYKASGASYHTG